MSKWMLPAAGVPWEDAEGAGLGAAFCGGDSQSEDVSPAMPPADWLEEAPSMASCRMVCATAGAMTRLGACGPSTAPADDAERPMENEVAGELEDVAMAQRGVEEPHCREAIRLITCAP